MTVLQIKNEVMVQTNNEVDDLGDFLPYLMDYINEGYDKLVYAYVGIHTGINTDSEYDTYNPLTSDLDEPKLPEWMHRSLVDWATWLVYRNGNPQKQNRGYPFRAAFDEVLGKITAEGGKNGKVRYFKNIPL